MNRSELIAQIRFQLSRLKPLNKHHDFERLALAYARARVAANLLPATGPVSAGGDQGRDFESFRTSKTSLPISADFVAASSGDEIVGACTLEASDSLVRKIKSDLAKIFSTEPQPTRVLYFCSDDLAVAKRHILADHCRQTHGATLTIFDGEAIAEHLADRDIFWIAVEFLDISAEAYPEGHVDEDYEHLRKKWLGTGDVVQNYADYVEIKRGLRIATFEDAVKADLTAWIDLMRTLIDDGYPPVIEQKARYEICVGELRGHGSLDPATPFFERFLHLTEPSATPNALNDAAVLFVYGSGAASSGRASIKQSYLIDHRTRLIEAIESQLSVVAMNVDRCTLLEARALLSGAATVAGLSLEKARLEMLRTWRALVDSAKTTALYPVERLGPIMEIMTTVHGSSREFRDLAADVDEVIAERTGKLDSGDRARRRALIHIENNDHLAAIDELQKVKIAYYSGETVDGSVLAMLLLAEQYQFLGLHIAARYFAACALFLSSQQEQARRLVSQAAFAVVKTFYCGGEGLTSLLAIVHAFNLHGMTAPDNEDWAKHPHVQAAIYHAEVYRTITSRMAPALIPAVDSVLASWPIAPQDLQCFRQVCEESFNELTDAELRASVDERLKIDPFLDIGPQTRYRWGALGLRWAVEFEPTDDDRFAALEIVATLQVAQADLADTDLLLVPGDVKLRVIRSDVTATAMKPVPSNDELLWTIAVPNSNAGRDLRQSGLEIMAVAMEALRHSSVMTNEAWSALIVSRMERGLPGRALFVRPPYEMLAMVQPTIPDNIRAMEPPRFDPPFPLAGNSDLAQPQRPGPGYSVEKARARIAKRYRIGLEAIALTLPRFLGDSRTCSMIADLRKSGWLDWQILLILGNAVAQWQVERVRGRPTSAQEFSDLKRAVHERILRREQEDDPIFILNALDTATIFGQERMLIMLCLKQWGLESHRQTPDFAAIRDMLSVRYGFASDDVEHADPFPGLSGPA